MRASLELVVVNITLGYSLVLCRKMGKMKHLCHVSILISTAIIMHRVYVNCPVVFWTHGRVHHSSTLPH